MTDKEYIEAVHELNSELFDKHNETEWSFWYRTNGYADQIGFEDFVVWCSEANGTQYNEETGEEMPILDVVRESIARYVKKFNRLFVSDLSDDGWTYCDDRLPDEDGDYFVTALIGDGSIKVVEMDELVTKAGERKWLCFNNVIAWRRKPEPAKERDV